ncbi:hypothetical protein JB92DRAFT_2998225 [Gautieria morchelliformis]|nr:hypothetical protein JB92DRAFT_2998225 [Gautieria morchelliformis]
MNDISSIAGIRLGRRTVRSLKDATGSTVHMHSEPTSDKCNICHWWVQSARC